MSLFWYHLFTTRTTHMLRTCSPNLIDLTYTIMGTEFVTVEKYSKELSQWKKKWDQHITNGNIKVIFSWDDLDCRKYKKKNIPSTHPQKIFPVNSMLYAHGAPCT